MADKGKTIFMITRSFWNEPHRGRHHYAMALSEKHKILWVNRQLGWREKGSSKSGVEKINDNLSVLHTGRNPLPAKIGFKFNRCNAKRLKLLKKISKGMADPDIVWIHDYKAVPLAEYYKGSAVTLYFCNDYYGEAAFQTFETKLAPLVDYVFATSPVLVERLNPLNANCTFIPHGVWLPEKQPEYKKKTAPENAGYVGTLRSNLDFEFLRSIIRNTKLKLILAGPIIECDKKTREMFERLFMHERVEYVGNLTRAQADEVLSEMDICLLPYTSKAKYGFVIKFFDYLAAGKPIVATKYDFVWPEPYAQFIHTYNGESGLQQFMSAVYSKWSCENFKESLALAKKSTWHQRIREVGEMMGIDL